MHDKPPPVVGPSHSSLPKAEPNINLFNYTYSPTYMHDRAAAVKSELGQAHKSLPGKSGLAGGLERDHHGREVLQNPPSLLPDHKSSVIVKNEGRELPKAPAPQQHSSSPKIMSYLNVQSVAPQHKSYEYKSPTQSPHHLHHLDGLQAAAKSIPPPPPAGHHRGGGAVPTTTTQLPSPHGHPPAPAPHSHNRQSPHAQSQHPHAQPPPPLPPHPSPPEPRYLNRSEQQGIPSYAPAKSAYPYPHPPTASPASHYAAPTTGSKPKVSSPAPQHFYGKPNSGIMTGTPVCRASEPAVAAPIPLTSKAGSSPFQQVPHHHVAPPPLPPPAHSRSVYDSRGPYTGSMPAGKLPPSLHGSPPTAASAPLSRPHVHPVHRTISPHQQPSQTMHVQPQISTAFQTQPLDLGVERSGSPKRKAPTPLLCDAGQPVALEVSKKRRTEEPQPQPLSLQCVGPPMLSRVSEPSPLIASAATSITTVVNTAALLAQPNTQAQERTVTAVSPAPRTSSGDGSVRPASTGSVCSLNPTPVSAVPSPAPIPSPAPSTAPSPAPSAPGTPAKVNNINTSTADSEKSNSPAPRPPSSTSYPVHKLKKAWLQRHSGEDGTEDTTGIVGSGSCVTLPLNISQVPSQPLNSKEHRESSSGASNTTTNNAPTSTCLPSAVNSIHNIGSMAVNSINKSKVTAKSGRKPANKESLNGHATDTKTPQEDSSSSDPERKSPPKRKPPKVSIYRYIGCSW